MMAGLDGKNMIFAVANLTSQSLAPCVPWEFQPAELPSPKVRGDKPERQAFYRNPNTQWMFYSGIEPSNPNMRTSKENPPRLIHAFVADFDAKIPDDRLDEVVASMTYKPAWIERSLGGNARLVWLLPNPLIVDTYDFSVAVLLAAKDWLQLALLPALDEGAFLDPCRLLCNGADWRATGHGALSAAAVQNFFVSCGKRFRFKGEEKSSGIPLEIIEPALKERYPAFDWPTDFVVDSQGPSFWIPGSLSPLSAIVNQNGMFSFADHAEKPFFTWLDLLGPEFVAKYEEDSISKATANIHWDGKHFWRKIDAAYYSLAKDELLTYFEVECKLAKKKVQEALSHIHNAGRVSWAAPYVFRPMGRITFLNRAVLNTYTNHIVSPSTEKTAWGAQGKFPFLSLLFDNLFDPSEQLAHFLAWWKHFYLSGVNLQPMPGQNTFLMGGVNVGKTLTNRKIIGRSVGGFMDASEYLMRSGTFNSELFEVPLWCVDDETMGESSQTQSMFQAMLKKTAANQQFRHSKKFEVGALTEWMGRVIITANLDYISSRALGPLDGNIADKTNVFRCSAESKIQFPSRHTLEDLIGKELPFLLCWLLEWEPPDFVIRDVRFGYRAYHDPRLLDHSHQSGRSAPFKELLIESLKKYFDENQDVPEWRGSVTKIFQLIQSDPLNDFTLRSFRVEQANRYLEMIQRDRVVPCRTEVGEMKTRLWIFGRFGDPVLILAPSIPQVALSVFSK